MNIINELRRKAKEESDASDRDRRVREEMHRRLMQRFDSEILPNVRAATVSEYNEWITGFVGNGGVPTHCYDYPLPRDVFVAVRDFKMIALYGSSSINVIVPEGIKVEAEDIGHCKLYFMDGFKCEGGFVPVYSDTKELK